MESPVQFSDAVNPVCLPTLGDTTLFTDRETVVIGWGTLREGKRSLLQFVPPI